jgi:transposase
MAEASAGGHALRTVRRRGIRPGKNFSLTFRTADAAGSKLYWIDIPTGQSIAAEVFVATLACSQLTYVEAIPSQRKTHFLAALSNALVYFGGVPQAITRQRPTVG